MGKLLAYGLVTNETKDVIVIASLINVFVSNNQDIIVYVNTFVVDKDFGEIS